jgi:hypothetical protein
VFERLDGFVRKGLIRKWRGTRKIIMSKVKRQCRLALLVLARSHNKISTDISHGSVGKILLCPIAGYFIDQRVGKIA